MMEDKMTGYKNDCCRNVMLPFGPQLSQQMNKTEKP